ncbi:MAG TPA: AMP-binding protein [Clostridia bacterium]|nr:AMP-binding protein [Clostridia bacterium]
MWLTVKDLLYRNNRRYPDKLAVANGSVRYTFGEFTKRCNRLANMLRSRGLGKGDRVAFLDKTCPWYLEFYYGIISGGMVAVPINYRLSVREILYILNDSKPEAIIVGKDYIELIDSIRPRLTSIKHFIAMDATEGYNGYHEGLDAASDKDLDDELVSEDLAAIWYTSGTTAMPKGAMLTHRNISANAVNLNLAISLTSDDVVYYPAALFHIIGSMAMGMMAMGCTMIFEDFALSEVCETIEKEKPNIVVTAAGAFVMLVNSDTDFSRYNLGSVQKVLAGAGPMRKVTGEKLFVALPGLEKLYFSFALTEASPFVTMGVAATRDTLAEGGYSEDSGTENFCVITKIVDDSGKEVPVGELGEITVRGPNVMSGYWNMPGETEKTIRDGWLYTGDVGYVDTNGRLFVVDRKKDMIISGGESIASAEVENVLFEHPNIKEAVIIGLPDEKWGERVHAVIVSDNSISLEGLIGFCRGKLAGYKIPRSYNIVNDLPRSPSGKILKRKLRERYSVRG